MATVAKPKHRDARALYLAHLDVHPGRTVGDDLDPLEAGIVGDSRHGSGYHISRQDNDADDYSVDESPRDRRGRSDTASAMDIGYFEIRTAKGVFDLYDYNRWLVGLCRTGDPDTADLREVIYSLDGTTVRRWDRLGKRSTGDNSHRTHTHLSEFRDADGQRMVNLARRWLTLIGLIDTEDDMDAGQAWQLHVTTYRAEAQRSLREEISVPALGSNKAFKEPNALAIKLREIAEKLDAIAATPPGSVQIPDEQLERVLRKVIGSVDESSQG